MTKHISLDDTTTRWLARYLLSERENPDLYRHVGFRFTTAQGHCGVTQRNSIMINVGGLWWRALELGYVMTQYPAPLHYEWSRAVQDLGLLLYSTLWNLRETFHNAPSIVELGPNYYRDKTKHPTSGDRLEQVQLSTLIGFRRYRKRHIP
jgi:hypothetical protein